MKNYLINVGLSKYTLETYPELKNQIENLMRKEEKRQIFRTSLVHDLDDNNVDIFIVNLDRYDITTIQNIKGYFILVGNDLSKLVFNNNACNNYFVRNLLDFNKIEEILLHIRKKIQKNSIIVPTSKGDYRLLISELNYIDIEGRSLCYHLANGASLCSRSMTTSFKKTISPLDEHDLLLFIKPSLLINVNHIRIIDTNRITFDNNDWLPVTKTQREIIQERWNDIYEFENDRR